jgi:hypothetical protein
MLSCNGNDFSSGVAVHRRRSPHSKHQPPDMYTSHVYSTYLAAFLYSSTSTIGLLNPHLAFRNRLCSFPDADGIAYAKGFSLSQAESMARALGPWS